MLDKLIEPVSKQSQFGFVYGMTGSEVVKCHVVYDTTDRSFSLQKQVSLAEHKD